MAPLCFLAKLLLTGAANEVDIDENYCPALSLFASLTLNFPFG